MHILMKKLFINILVLAFLGLSQILHAQNFRTSEWIYRIPYTDGTEVEVTNDHWTHSPPGRIDMIAVDGLDMIVAAAPGEIMAIVDSNDESCWNSNNCSCTQFNNYVWLKHANGEWTKYTHFETGSVTALGHQVGDLVLAGDPLGNEGDVGCATGVHLHFEVAYPTTTQVPPYNPAGGGMIEGNAINRIPVICDIADNIFVEDENYIAAPCDDNCLPYGILSQDYIPGSVEVKIREDSIFTLGTPEFYFGSAGMLRSGGKVRLKPGFRAHAGSRVSVLIKECNEN